MQELGYLHDFYQVFSLNGMVGSHKVSITARSRVEISIECNSSLQLFKNLKYRVDLRMSLSVSRQILAKMSI